MSSSPPAASPNTAVTFALPNVPDGDKTNQQTINTNDKNDNITTTNNNLITPSPAPIPSSSSSASSSSSSAAPSPTPPLPSSSPAPSPSPASTSTPAAAAAAAPASSAAPAAAPVAAPAPEKPKGPPPLTPQQEALMKDVLDGNVQRLMTCYADVNWNFTKKVVGRNAPQSPFGLLIRPELSYTALSNISVANQLSVIKHVLSLPPPFTPRLDSLLHPAGGIFCTSVSMDVIQCVYQGRVDILKLLIDESKRRAAAGKGVVINLREKFFPSRITLLHMACHDGRLEMAQFLLQQWKDAARADDKPSEFTADIADGAGQTPLFWVFARGPVNPVLAEYLVENEGADFFKVFELHQLDDKKNKIFKGYASPFSLAIKNNREFCEAQLHKRLRIVGVKFQNSLVQMDFTGVTIHNSLPNTILERMQKGDIMNDVKEADYVRVRQERAIQDIQMLINGKDQLLDKEKSNEIALKIEGNVGPATIVPITSPPKDVSTSSSSSSSPTQIDISSLSLLRFVQQINGDGRPPINGWDSFHYDSNKQMTALEMMVEYRCKNLLLTPIMREIQNRMWRHVVYKFYYPILFLSLIFGFLFAVSSGIWPRTQQILMNLQYNVSQSIQGGEELTWSVLWVGSNVLMGFISIALLSFRIINMRASGLRQSLLHPSSMCDLAIFTFYWIILICQSAVVCHVPNWGGICHNDMIHNNFKEIQATIIWLTSILHILFGIKILELLSVYEFAGPLLATILGMFLDLKRFLQLFLIGILAFSCALWPILKDMPDNDDGTDSTDVSGPQKFRYSYDTSFVQILFWVFLNYDYTSFSTSYLQPVQTLGRLLLFLFLIFMVLMMLNLMIAMLNNTYNDVAKDGKGEWLLGSATLLCQFVKMAQGHTKHEKSNTPAAAAAAPAPAAAAASSSTEVALTAPPAAPPPARPSRPIRLSLEQRYIIEMATENNCSLERSGTALSFAEEAPQDTQKNFARTIENNFLQLENQLKAIKIELMYAKSQRNNVNNYSSQLMSDESYDKMPNSFGEPGTN